MGGENTVVHVTHEAAAKIGGIGAVLHGFFTCPSYLDAIDRSLLISPLFTTDGPAAGRLGDDGEVLHSSLDGITHPRCSPLLQEIERTYHVATVYGHRTFTDSQTTVQSTQEVLLIDVRHMNLDLLNEFKQRLFEVFAIQSHLHEHLWEYEQYVRVALPALAAIKALGATEGHTTIIAHEFMGMPTALAAILDHEYDFRTVFHAHEVATMRRIVEEHAGHDTMFYNVMREAQKSGLYVDEVFGDQNAYFKHALVQASRYCDHIYAVGDLVAEELRFLAADFETEKINIVYNGIPAYEISAGEKYVAKEKLRRYCLNLLGYRPDYVFTHVTRLVRSKGLWRDLRVLREMDLALDQEGKTAVYYLLSTEVARRPNCDVRAMEATYGWPVAHREGWPDLSGGEANFYSAVQQFNAESRRIKAIFINQFGFDPRSCGLRMPEEMEFMDIRKGSDVEFGQSIYEPFGIAQLEPLTFGGICVLTNVCGCTGFLRDVTDAQPVPNVIVADYTDLAGNGRADLGSLLHIDRSFRDRIEIAEAARVAKEIMARLPRNETQIEQMNRRGYELAHNMSWDTVVCRYLLNDLALAQTQRERQRDYMKA